MTHLPCCADTLGNPMPCQHSIRAGQRRRTVVEAMHATGRSGKTVNTTARLSCGHVVLRTYHVSVGQTAYCAPCGEVSS